MNVRLLNSNAFLNVFTVFGLLLVLFVITYFFLRLLRARVSFDKYAKGSNFQLVFDFFLGAAFGAGTFAASFLQEYFATGLPTVIVVNFVFVASWLFNYRFFLGASLVAVGSLIYNRNSAVNDSEWIINMVFLAAVLLLLSIVNIVRRRFTWIGTGLFFVFSIFVFHSIVALVLYLTAAIRPSADFYAVNLAASFIFAVFSYWLALLVDRGLFGTRTLSSLARHDYASFVKQTYANEELHAFIVKKGYTHGALLSFFVISKNTAGAEQTLYRAIKSRFANKDCLLISLASRFPSVYIPIRGNFYSTKDLETTIRALISVAIVDLKNTLGEEISFKAFFSIYGLNAGSSSGLLRINLNYLLSPNSLSKSRLASYSPKKALSVEKEAAEVERFLNSPAPSTIEYSIQKASVINNAPVYTAELTSVPLVALDTEQCYQRIDADLVEIAQRYYAMKIISEFFNSNEEGTILVYYPVALFLRRNFSLKDFLNKLEAQGFDWRRIAFCLNISRDIRPSNSQLIKLRELLSEQKVQLNFALRSDVRVLAPVNVIYLLKGNNEVVRNVLLNKRTPKVHYHKKVQTWTD